MAGFKELVTVDQSVEAHLIKSRLEAAGIYCDLHHEHVSNLVSHPGLMGAGIRIMVMEVDYEAALAFLDPHPDARISCPNCKSTRVENLPPKGGRLLNFLMMLAGMIILTGQKSAYRCEDCQAEFTDYLT
ncbi:DUF2007 domain-containing protein [Persicobacter diffluens]|uniref:DUF2007 domain-containing protein n=1 Tax=Persicobacter diffluens TaxID=981 RepID=A0AAN5APG4_9BACT|nr:hypothetical protein PEDI_43600 [Persicobacter diffluens]